MANQIVLLWLGSYYLIKRPVLVEQQIRISVAKDSGTFRSKHEEFVASVGHEEGPAFVLSAFQRSTIG